MNLEAKTKIFLKKAIKVFLFIFYYGLLVALFISGIVFGIITLIPDDASKPCYLGYYAHCSFTPFSTIILFVMSSVVLYYLIKLTKDFKVRFRKLLD